MTSDKPTVVVTVTPTPDTATEAEKAFRARRSGQQDKLDDFANAYRFLRGLTISERLAVPLAQIVSGIL